jgi:hypothetical protein
LGQNRRRVDVAGISSLVVGYSRKLHVWVASRSPVHTVRAEVTLKSDYKAVGCDPLRWRAKLLAGAYVIAGDTPIIDGLGAVPE